MKYKTRQDILKLNKVFTNHLLRVQRAKYAPDCEYLAGEEIYLNESDETVVLTKEQAEKLNAEEQEYFELNKDSNPFGCAENENWTGSAILISNKKDPNSYLHDLGISLEKLRLATQSQNLMVLGDWATPWLHQDNDYKPVKETLDWLKTQIDTEFDGGFLLNEVGLIQFIPRLFWLTRCNTALPEFMMTFENYKTVISICKHGCLHIDSYNQVELDNLIELYQRFGFKQIENCYEPINFDNL